MPGNESDLNPATLASSCHASNLEASFVMSRNPDLKAGIQEFTMIQ